MTDTRAIRVALYARVSTSNHGQDVTLQTREPRNSSSTAAGSSPGNMRTWGFPARESVATAVDCELSRLFLKWQQLAALRANIDPDDEAIEKMLLGFKNIADKIEEVCRLLDTRGIDEFVRSSESLREAVEKQFTSLRIGCLAKDLQRNLFWPRNKVLHAGYARFSDADAARCYSFAQLALHIFSMLDEAKRQEEEKRLTRS